MVHFVNTSTPVDVINMISIYQVESLYKVISMFIKTSFVITIILDLLTLMIIPIRTFECKL